MQLTEQQIQLITPAAKMRAAAYEDQRQGMTQKRNVASDKYNYNLERFYQQQFDALAAEALVAQYLNQPFDPFNKNRKAQADVGHNVEVKHTLYLAGRLPIHPYDRPGDLSVLVTSHLTSFTLVGWFPVSLAREIAGITGRDGTIWIDRQHLARMSALHALVQRVS